MEIPEVEHLRLRLEHARLKKQYLELQVANANAQFQLVYQEISQLEKELSILTEPVSRS